MTFVSKKEKTVKDILNRKVPTTSIITIGTLTAISPMLQFL